MALAAKSKTVILAAALLALGWGCAKTPRKQARRTLAQASGPAGTQQVPPASSTHPQSGWGTGGTGPAGAGGEHRVPEVGTGGSSGSKGSSPRGKSHPSKGQQHTGGSPGGGGTEGSSSSSSSR
jgi:hypothetical protein